MLLVAGGQPVFPPAVARASFAKILAKVDAATAANSTSVKPAEVAA
jgi:hypothetical protein